jgi:hypothetical protein
MKIVSAFALAASLAVSASAFALTPSDLYGSPANGSAASRQITIDSHTHYINVKHGDTVTFTNGTDTVTWYFDGISSEIPLAKIFPAAAPTIEVYIEPDTQA